MQDYPDLSKHQVYACGAPMVIESAKREETKARRLKEAIRLLTAGKPLGLK